MDPTTIRLHVLVPIQSHLCRLFYSDILFGHYTELNYRKHTFPQYSNFLRTTMCGLHSDQITTGVSCSRCVYLFALRNWSDSPVQSYSTLCGQNQGIVALALKTRMRKQVTINILAQVGVISISCV